jgi:hypothetical protein
MAAIAKAHTWDGDLHANNRSIWGVLDQGREEPIAVATKCAGE